MKTGLVLSDPIRLERRNIPNQKFPRKPALRESVLIHSAKVTIQGYFYLVDFGTDCAPRYHQVDKNKECSCGAPYCQAIEVVRQYLQAGGIRAPDPPGEPVCPICGGKTYRDRNWDGKYSKTLGWRCEKGGLRHFLEAKAERIKKQQAENPWLIPPAPDYPGVRRDDVLTWEECEAINHKVFLETGYDPTA